MKTTLIQLRVGDKVIYEPEGRKMILTIYDYKLTPNGVNNPNLVCLISAKREDGFKVEATSDKFIPLNDCKYISIYEQSIYK